jgi:predicted esterase
MGMKKREFSGPHQGMPVRYGGSPVERAKGGMIMMHGRGAGAHDMLKLAEAFDEPQFFYAAPEAREQSWYPYHFADPVSDNEPGFSSGLVVIDDMLKGLSALALPPEQIILFGFSQGACLVLEYAARNPRRYGGLVGLSGCLFGPDANPYPYEGSLEGTPVILGCSEGDPHFPAPRVTAAAETLKSLGAEVTTRLYPEPGHGVNEDEIRRVKEMIQAIEGKA